MSGQTPYMSATPYGYPTSFPQRDNRYPGNSNVETAMALNRRPSLLAGYHNPYSSPERTAIPPYLFSLAAPIPMGPHGDEHSKRSRYPSTLPLAIDVKKEQPLYQPQTEAISPILDEPKLDSNIRDTTVIRNSISKLDSEIEITMKELHRAKLSQSKIKSRADRSAADEDDNDNRDTLLKLNGSQTLIEKILHDNRKKAENSQQCFNQLNNHMDLTIPLYQEPNDLSSMENIRRQYMNVMKNRLVNLFKKSRERYMQRTKFESKKYDHVYERWQKSIEKDEKTILAKDISTYRETFEKTFSEIRKAREDKEKKQTNSETINDQQQTSIITTEQDNEPEEDYEKMKKSSIIPPIMYDSWQRKHQYFNQNNFIRIDAAIFYKEKTMMPYWSPEEKQIFIEKFTQSPKNFGYISSFLENKTTEQCVQFYYMTKKRENYKNLLRKQTQTTRRRAKQATTTTTTTTVTSSTTIETTLVTKVTSSNTIFSSTSQQILGSGQDADRVDNDDDRRENNSGDPTENKSSNKNRCQLLSCTNVRKKNRKNRLRTFPNKWNTLSKDHQDEIRRLLQIPSDIQRCCTRCYEKLLPQIEERQSNQDDDDEKTSNEEWNEEDIQKLNEAFEKFPHDWPQIAEYVQRNEESCRDFYLKSQRKTLVASDDHNLDEDNGSISGSELGQIKPNNDDHLSKPINEDSNDSPHGMVIDENDEQSSIIEEKSTKSVPSTSNLTTITSLVEKEISKTLIETEKRSMNTSPERPIPTPTIPPPPLVNLNKSHSQYPSQPFPAKGSIMRGTPISSSNKPISIDISPSSHPHSHHYNNHLSRNDYAHMKSPKILDRNLEQQHLLQQQQQQQHAAYMRHFNQQQYLQQKNSTNKNDLPSTDTFETLRADYLTSKYLTTTHSPNHERSHRSPPQPSPSLNQGLLPPPTAIVPQNSNPSIQSSHHQQQQQQQAALLASQLLNSAGVYPQELLTSGMFPYPSYYGSLPANSPFLIDPRYMHEYANAVAANNEQLKVEHQKAMRLSRHHHHPPHGPPVPAHSPPDAAYSSSKRHSHDLGYPTADYPSSIWRTQNMTNPSQQQLHSSLKLNSGTNKNPLLELNELSRHSSTRPTETDSRSPDDYRHRLNPTRSTVESPSAHFQRVEAHNHHKSSHEKSNLNLHYSDHPSDSNTLNYIRQTANLQKSQVNHPSPHRHHHHPTNRSLPPQISPHQQQAYLLHGHHHPSTENLSRQLSSHYSSQQRQTHSNESIKNSKESISIQEFMNKTVNEFVGSTNSDNKSSGLDSTSHEVTRSHQINNFDQPILINGDDDDDDSNPNDQSDSLNKSNTDSDMPEKRRDSSIKKILSNQPLEKQEYVEINQKVQNSAINTSKIHSTNDLTNLERSNSLSGRTRSRGSITMRMLMGEGDIYADGKVQTNSADESTTKRPKSPDGDKVEKLEYLIRDALDRECPPVGKRNESSNVFQISSNLPPSKRLRSSPNEDESNTLRHPFALQSHEKTSHQQTLPSNPDKNWQSINQQRHYHIDSQFPSRPTGSITQGNPISPSLRLSTDQSSSSKNEQSTSPHDHSPKAKIIKRTNQTSASSPSDNQQELAMEHRKSPTSPPVTNSPTISNSSHSLKKRLISEYELEQQRNSPVVPSVEEPPAVEPTNSKPSEDAEPST